MKAIIVLLAVLFAGQTMACEHSKSAEAHKAHTYPCAEHGEKHEKKIDDAAKQPSADSKPESTTVPAGK
jgi:hypothetical protein